MVSPLPPRCHKPSNPAMDRLRRRPDPALSCHLGYGANARVSHDSVYAALRLHRRPGRAGRPRPRSSGDRHLAASFNYHLSAPYNQWSFTADHLERAAALLSAAFFPHLPELEAAPHRGSPALRSYLSSVADRCPRPSRKAGRHGPSGLHHCPRGQQSSRIRHQPSLPSPRNGQSIDDTHPFLPCPRRGGAGPPLQHHPPHPDLRPHHRRPGPG